MAKDPKKRFCFVYKTTNLINQKYYIGCHCTYKLDDGYLGSGLRIRRSVAKYGEANFKLEILEFFESREKALAREKELVTEELLNDPMCMNIQPGGRGGWASRFGQKGNAKMKLLRQTDPEWTEQERQRGSLRGKAAYEAGHFKHYDWSGHSHKTETIEVMRQKALGRASGELNGRFGSIWIHHPERKQCISIKKDDLESYLTQGWSRGRKMTW